VPGGQPPSKGGCSQGIPGAQLSKGMTMKHVLAATTLAAILTTPALAQVGVGVSGGATGDIGVGVDIGGVGVETGVSGNASGDASSGSAGGIAGTGSNGSIGAATDVMTTGVGTRLDIGTTGSTGSADYFHQAVSSIRSSHKAATEIAAVTNLDVVDVVEIDALAEGQNSAALDNAISDHAEAAGSLRSSIAANTVLSAALQDKGVDLSSVVAATVNADGSVTIYTR
jgi:hypothetical protein